MKISEIKMHNICPFEVKDSKLQLLFSFFLHKAPTIDSRLAIKSKKYDVKWKSYIKNWKEKTYRFYSKQIPSENILSQYKLTDIKEVGNKDRAFVCTKKDPTESDYECFARHLRNSIAHGFVFMVAKKNRTYLFFEDYNKNKNRMAIILVSKSDLEKLKIEMERDT